MPLAAARLLGAFAAAFGVCHLLQMSGLDAVRHATKMVHVQTRVVATHEDDVGRDVGPSPPADLLVHAPLATVAADDQAAVVSTNRTIDEVRPQGLLSEMSGQAHHLRQHLTRLGQSSDTFDLLVPDPAGALPLSRAAATQWMP